MAHLGQGPHLDKSAVAEDPDLVTKCFDFAHDVRREKDGLAAFLGFVDATAEGLLHERVEPAGGLVENEQVRSGHQGRDQDDLLTIPLGVGANLLGRIEIEPGHELLAVGLVHLSLHPAQQVQGLFAGQRGPQVCLARDVGQAPVGIDRSMLAVETEDLGSSRRRLDQPQQQSDGRRLPGAVGAEISHDLPGRISRLRSTKASTSP